MAEWQEKAAARLDVRVSEWYDEMLNTPDSHVAAQQLWEHFVRTYPEWSGVGLSAAIDRRDAVRRGGYEMTLRTVAGDICARALDECKWMQLVHENLAVSPTSADEYLQAA